jgi:polygalacturonase
MRSVQSLVLFASLAVARPAASVQPEARSSDCTGTVSSLSSVAAAVACTTVNINAFTVDAGKTLELDLLAGTTVNMRTRDLWLWCGRCAYL